MWTGSYARGTKEIPCGWPTVAEAKEEVEAAKREEQTLKVRAVTCCSTAAP